MEQNILVAQLGARRHYQQPLIFHKLGMLSKFYTDLYADNNFIFNTLRNSKIYDRLPLILKKLLDRYDLQLNNASITHFPLFSLRWTKAMRSSTFATRSSVKLWAYQEFCSKILKTDIGNSNIFYGYNGASLELFDYAKKQGKYCILDQTIADRTLLYKLLDEEEKKWINWTTNPMTINDRDIKLMEREHQEQDLADLIICGSNFVKKSLIERGVREDKIIVASMGQIHNDISSETENSEFLRKDSKELNILFAGAVGLRKGIPYLLKALKKIKGQIPYKCKIAGSIEIDRQRINEYKDVCEFLGVVPRSQMDELYRWADMFILPSICEGSAMVIYEALNHNLPVLTTENSGSIVRNNIDGWIINIRDYNAIASKILDHYHKPLAIENKQTSDYLAKTHHEQQTNMLQSINKMVSNF